MATKASRSPTHGFPEYLPAGKNSVAQWAGIPDGSLVIFVHGFGGDAIATWNDMQAMLPADPRAAGTDLVYFGYESTRSRATVHADEFLRFVEDLLRRGRRYDRIVLAAHSLGAIVVRRAIIMAHGRRDRWVRNARAVLFGPAHRGASVQKLVAQGTGTGLLSALYSFALYRIPVLQDLHPDDSKILSELQSEYAREMGRKPKPPLLARSIFGSKDTVVELLDFHPGERLEIWKGHDHFSVCKPNTHFSDPVDAVMEALK